MDDAFGYFACVFWMIILIVGLNDHNKKVEKQYPDNSDLRVSLYGHYFLLIAMIGLLIREIIRSFT